MTRFGSEELVRYEGSLNRSSAWACEAVAGVERAIRALLSPPWRPCTARAAFNLATTRRCCVAVRAIVKPYVLGRTRKHTGVDAYFLARNPCLFADASHTAVAPGAHSGSLLHFSTWGLPPKTPHGVFTQELTIVNSYCAHLRGPFSTWGFPLSAQNDTD